MSLSLSPALRQTLVYGLGMVMMKGISLMMLPVITGYIPPAQYGELELLVSLAALSSLLVECGLSDAMFRFAGAQTSTQGRHQVSANAFGLALIIGIVALILGQWFAPQIAAWLPIETRTLNVRLILLAVALGSCIGVPLAWLRMEGKAVQFLYLSSGQALIQAALVVWGLHAGYGVTGVLAAGAISAALLAIVLLSLHLRACGVALNAAQVRSLLMFGGPLIISGIAAFALAGLDRWILADQVGTAAMAPYAIAAKFALIAALVMQPYGMWWFSQRYRIVNAPDGKYAAARFAGIGVALTIITSVAIGLGASVVIRVLIPASYHDALEYVPWLVLAMAIKGCADMLSLGCFIRRTGSMPMAVNLVAAGIGWCAYMFLIPGLGAFGAIYALLLAQTARLFMFVYLGQRVLYLPYASNKLLALGLVGVAVLSLGQIVSDVWQQAAYAVLAAAMLLLLAVIMDILPRPAAMWSGAARVQPQ